MSAPVRLTVFAALAVALSCASLLPLYAGLGWVPGVVGAIGSVALAGVLSRSARVPVPFQPLVALLAVGVYVVATYARPTLTHVVVPTRETAALLTDQFRDGMADAEELIAPVATDTSVVLLAVLGVALVAIVVDLIAAGLRRPAVAGLPLLVLFAVPSAMLSGGVGWFPFALGAIGWMALLLADGVDRLGKWGAALRSGTSDRGVAGRVRPIPPDASLQRVGRRIGLAALGVAVIVPALAPGLDTRLIGVGGLGGGGSRSTTTYNPITELGGQLRLPEPRLLLTYRTTDPAPDYLRLTTLDRFDDDSGWSSSELRADVRDDAVSNGIPRPISAESAPVQLLSAAIRVQNLGGPWLPVPFRPTDVEVEGPWLWDRRSETVFSTRTDLGELDDVYRVNASRVRPAAALLRQDIPPPEPILQFAQPPEVSDFVRELTDQIVAGAESRYDEVAAIQAYFRDDENGFRYSEDASVPEISAPNALEAFLRGKQGFCEQYASAMAAMVRLRGIPARVAVGFTPGERQADGSYAVTTNDAHAWPEVWFSGAGWVRFEPTPRASQVSTPGYTIPPLPSEGGGVGGADGPNLLPGDGGVPDAGAGPGLDGRQERDLPGDAAAGAGTTVPAAERGLRIALLVTALLLVAAPVALTAWRRRRRWAVPGPLAAWAQVQEDATDIGYRWRPADSPRAAAARLENELALPGNAPEALYRVALAAERARYSRVAPQSGPDEVAALRRDVTTVRSALLATTSDTRRWAARLAPPSTLRWAGSLLAGRTADLLDRVDDLVTAVGTRLHRRRARRARA